MNSIQTIRDNFEKLGNAYLPAVNCPVSQENIAGVPCFWYGKRQKRGNKAFLVYVHGGGFFLGDHKSHGAWASHLAKRSKRPVLLIEYSLAPESKFPVALNQIIDVLQALIRRSETEGNFSILGDSAGGNLALAASCFLKEKASDKQARSTILISPWLDLECKNASFERNKKTDKDLTKEGLQECVQRYVANEELKNPLLSPINADFHTLDPVFIACGSDEILEDDSLSLCKLLERAGVSYQFCQFKGQGHSWSYYDVNSQASLRLFREINKFLRKQELEQK